MNEVFQRYKSTSWICDIPFGRDMRGGAWVDLYHITFLHSRNISQFAQAKLYHIGEDELPLTNHGKIDYRALEKEAENK